MPGFTFCLRISRLSPKREVSFARNMSKRKIRWVETPVPTMIFDFRPIKRFKIELFSSTRKILTAVLNFYQTARFRLSAPYRVERNVGVETPTYKTSHPLPGKKITAKQSRQGRNFYQGF